MQSVSIPYCVNSIFPLQSLSLCFDQLQCCTVYNLTMEDNGAHVSYDVDNVGNIKI